MMMIRVVVDMCGLSSGRAILQERCPSVPGASSPEPYPAES
jgi:hypothetical protein